MFIGAELAEGEGVGEERRQGAWPSFSLASRLQMGVEVQPCEDLDWSCWFSASHGKLASNSNMTLPSNYSLGPDLKAA